MTTTWFSEQLCGHGCTFHPHGTSGLRFLGCQTLSSETLRQLKSLHALQKQCQNKQNKMLKAPPTKASNSAKSVSRKTDPCHGSIGLSSKMRRINKSNSISCWEGLLHNSFRQRWSVVPIPSHGTEAAQHLWKYLENLHVGTTHEIPSLSSALPPDLHSAASGML